MSDVANPPERLAFSIKTASEAIDVSTDKIRDEIRAGRLRARKLGRRTIIIKEDLNRWLAQLPILTVSLILMVGALTADAASEWQAVASQSDLTSQYRPEQPFPSEAGSMVLAINLPAINRAASTVLPSPGATLISGVDREHRRNTTAGAYTRTS